MNTIPHPLGASAQKDAKAWAALIPSWMSGGDAHPQRTAEDIGDMRKCGIQNLSIDQLVNMPIHGIELKVTCPAVGTLQHLGGDQSKVLSKAPAG